MNDSQSAMPQNKVLAATVGAAVATILIYVVEQATGADLPTGVEGAITILAVFGAGYVVRDSD